MSIIGFVKPGVPRVDVFQYQDLSGNAAAEYVNTSLTGGVIVHVAGQGTPEGDEFIDVKLDGVSVLQMSALDPVAQKVSLNIQSVGDLTVEYTAGGVGNTAEAWDLAVTQLPIESLITTKAQFGAVLNARLWDRYFGSDSGLKAAALESIQNLGFAELDGGDAIPTWAVDRIETYEESGAIVQRQTAYSVDTAQKAATEASQLQQAKNEKIQELEDWWKNQNVLISLPATEKSTGTALTQFELAIFEDQRSVNQLQLGEWKMKGGVGTLTLVDYQFYSVIIAEADVLEAETAFRVEYEGYGTHWDVTKRAILAATTVAALDLIEVLPA